MKPSVLLFDLDQTLLSSKAFRLKQAFIWRGIGLLRKRGFSFFSALQFLDEMKKSMSAGSDQKLNSERIYELLQSKVSHLSAEQAKEWVDSWVHDTFQGLLRHFSPIVEGEKLIQDLQRGPYRLVLATNPAWPARVTELRLNVGSLKFSQFEWVTTAENMHFTKPDLRYYQEILQKMKVKPEDCLMIGDSFKKDAVAVNIGIPTFIIRPESKTLSPLLSQGPISELRKRILPA